MRQVVGEHIPPSGTLRASVLLLHGYAARGAVHRDDGRAFADEGVEVWMPDAPGHGGRADGHLERIAALNAQARRAAIVDLAHSWVPELQRLARERRAAGARRVALVGTSMGGFAALGALRAPRCFDAIAALLAGPDRIAEDELAADRPPVLIGLAGKDAAVPPAPAMDFARRIGAELHEYPESEHLMRGQDWDALWSRVAAFVRRHLAER